MAIKVECIQASRDLLTGKHIYTLVCEYPRTVHSQLLTHSVFSKNSSSTRAIPVLTAIDQIINNPAEYVWTINQSGMQGELATAEEAADFEVTYLKAMGEAIESVKKLAEQGAHKQNAGRLLEPFQNIKIVLTATEWANWDWLRDDKDAQGEIAQLARAMKEARDGADAIGIYPGEWHVPFVERHRNLETGKLHYYLDEEGEEDEAATELCAEVALDVSASVCAQVSYRKADFSLEKASKIKGMLINGRRVHASPFEHQATPISNYAGGLWLPSDWDQGVTHRDRDGNFWSNNFQSFVQQRSLIPNNVKKD